MTTNTVNRVHTVMDIPLGRLTLVGAGGALTGMYMEQYRHRPRVETFGDLDGTPFQEAERQLAAYFRGELRHFDLELSPSGTPFQLRVWQALREIPYGETVSYGELAERLGVPTAARAVGLANGKNPISVIVPCHRVIGADGSLTGYGGGLQRKRYLLDFEQSEATLF
ncbi:MAG: methylated-DNA--[protein]-cysteine S-methyltransferase [Sciscionella sp.]